MPVLLTSLLAGTTAADQVITPSADHARIRISGYSDGDLHVRFADGSITSISLLEVTRVVVSNTDRLADFNEAERYLAGGKPVQAVLRYQRALRRASGFWPEVIRVRLVQACDRAGQLDRATHYLLEVIAEAPAVAARLFPRSIPDRATATTRSLDQRLVTEGNSAADAEQRLVIRLLRFWILHRTNAPRATAQAREVAGLAIPPDIASQTLYNVKTAALERLLADGQSQLVLDHANATLEVCPLAAMPDLLMLKGQALLSRAADRETQLRAASAFMRLPIHFPDHERVPQALLLAAEIHAKLGLADDALRLLDECLDHQTVAPEIRARAEAERARLKAATSG